MLAMLTMPTMPTMPTMLAIRTKATRDAIAAKKKRRYRKALVRVRFPDGVLIQATFSVKAPVSLLLQWVSEGLREPYPHQRPSPSPLPSPSPSPSPSA